MPKASLQDFLQDRNLLAMKFSSRDLSGLFTKRFTVPMNTIGMALFPDGAVSLFTEGREVAGKFELLLAKVGDVHLRLTFEDLRSQDGFPVHGTVGLIVQIATGQADLLKDFSRTLFNFPGTYGAGDLKATLAPELRKTLAVFASGQEASALHKRDRFREVDALLAPALERLLFGAGIVLRKVVEIAFTSEGWSTRAAADARRHEDEERERALLQKKEDRVKRLASFLQEQSVQDLLAKIPDDRLKGVLYAKLMEDENVRLSAKDLIEKAGQVGGDMVGHIYRAMEGLLGSGAAISPSALDPDNADLLLVVAGTKVFALDIDKGEVVREYSFRDPLRSVRLASLPAGESLLAGCRSSVQAAAVGSDGAIAEYPLPSGRNPKGGVNAVAAHGGSIFATHSEFGLARWAADRPGSEAELLFGDLTSSHKTTRAVQVDDGRLFFVSGPRVYAAALGNGLKAVEYVDEDDTPVTALAAGAGALFAGTEGGRILTWKLDEPDKPVTLVRVKDGISNLRLAVICGIPHLLYTTKGYSVRARVLGQNLETAYETGGTPVAALDACSNLIAAVETSGRRVLVWRAASPARPALSVDASRWTGKPVLDLWLRKIRAE